jgi:hypothetical protein
VSRKEAKNVAYTPSELTVYTAAYSGAIAGCASSGRIILDGTPADYAGQAMISGAFAQSFDLAWEINPDTDPPDTLQVFIIEKACKGVWENRNTEVTSETLLPQAFTELCNGIIALIMASESYVTGQGITPNPWPTAGGGGTVTSVAAGTGISVTGTPTVAPVINNTGVTSIVAGAGIYVSGPTGAVTVSNTGVASVVAGTNVTITGTATNPIVNAAGDLATGPSNGNIGTLVALTTSPQTLCTLSITAPGNGFLVIQGNASFNNKNAPTNVVYLEIFSGVTLENSNFVSSPNTADSTGWNSLSLGCRIAITTGAHTITLQCGTNNTVESGSISGAGDLEVTFVQT